MDKRFLLLFLASLAQIACQQRRQDVGGSGGGNVTNAAAVNDDDFDYDDDDDDDDGGGGEGDGSGAPPDEYLYPTEDPVSVFKMRGEQCRQTCDVFAGYATGVCAGMGAFAAPLVCFLQNLAAISCAIAQGVLWGISDYCTSSTVYRTCELCSDGVGFTDLYSRQVEVNEKLVNVGDFVGAMASIKEEMQAWTGQWRDMKQDMSYRISSEAHFEDVDHLLQLVQDLEFNPPGVPVEDYALRELTRTALSPGKEGGLSLINQMHRLLSGGGVNEYFGGQRSIFEMDPRFCQVEYVRHLERILFNLYQAFFFAGKISGFDEEEMDKFKRAFAEKRGRQRVKIVEVCMDGKNNRTVASGNSTKAEVTTGLRNMTGKAEKKL